MGNPEAFVQLNSNSADNIIGFGVVQDRFQSLITPEMLEAFSINRALRAAAGSDRRERESIPSVQRVLWGNTVSLLERNPQNDGSLKGNQLRLIARYHSKDGITGIAQYIYNNGLADLPDRARFVINRAIPEWGHPGYAQVAHDWVAGKVDSAVSLMKTTEEAVAQPKVYLKVGSVPSLTALLISSRLGLPSPSNRP